MQEDHPHTLARLHEWHARFFAWAASSWGDLRARFAGGGWVVVSWSLVSLSDMGVGEPIQSRMRGGAGGGRRGRDGELRLPAD